MSNVRAILRESIRFDRSKISMAAGARNTVGVIVPLVIGAMSGHLVEGLTAATGALTVAFSDSDGPYRLRGARMLLAAIGGAVSVFFGSATGGVHWLAVLLAMIWGFGFGMLVSLGPVPEQIGLTSIVLFLIYGAFPLPLPNAAAYGGLVLLGGSLQALLAVAAWPIRSSLPERVALAAVFHALTAYSRDPDESAETPPASAEVTAASTALIGMGAGRDDTADGLRILLNEAERIRLELMALRFARREQDMDAGTSAGLRRIWDLAGEMLDALATAIRAGQPVENGEQRVARMTDEIDALEALGPAGRYAARHARALVGQLRACVDVVGRALDEHERQQEINTPGFLRPRGWSATLRANLTPHSASFRHALRLAISLAVASALARTLGLSRVYWVPMTVAIVLKPDFSSTFTRGVARVVGTMLGLVVATLLVAATLGQVGGKIAMIGVLVFLIRSVGRANFGLSAIGITALVVLLTAFQVPNSASTIQIRAVDTLIGGGLSLLIYLIWPTWERTQTPGYLATLLDAYRVYVRAVFDAYTGQEAARARLDELRLSARLARSNAEASLTRTKGEPSRREKEINALDGILANGRRFVTAVMALEAGLYSGVYPPPADALEQFAGDVEATLQLQAQALRSGEPPAADLPDLRAAQNILASYGADTSEETSETAFTAQTERLANSLNTMTDQLRAWYQAVGTP